MNKHDYKQNAYYLVYLIRCVLNDKIPAKETLDKMDLSGVFAVAKAHSLTAIATYALESAGIYDNAFEEEKNKAIRKVYIPFHQSRLHAPSEPPCRLTRATFTEVESDVDECYAYQNEQLSRTS